MRREWCARELARCLLVAAATTSAFAAECPECDAAAGAADLPAYQGGTTAGHHPVGGAYPPADDSRYVQPDARAGEVRFFDRNGNGGLDADEVRLSAGGTLECASCHRAHVDGAPAGAAEPGQLRGSNADSALCRTCHRI